MKNGDFVDEPAFELVEDDRFALFGGQCGECGARAIGTADIGDVGGGRVVLAEREEARPERAAAAIAMDVDDDAVEPGSERGVVAERVELVECAEQRFLEEVVAVGTRASKAARKGLCAGMKRLDQAAETLVALFHDGLDTATPRFGRSDFVNVAIRWNQWR